MKENHQKNNRISFPIAELISQPEHNVDPGIIENLGMSGRFLPEINLQPGFCFSNLKQGCYRVSYKPNNSVSHFHGSLRVDRGEEQVAISGDLYKHWPHFDWRGGIKFKNKPLLAVSRLKRIETLRPLFSNNIPVYSRDRYYSYLKITQIENDWRSCELRMTMEEHTYNVTTEGFSLARSVEVALTRQAGTPNKYKGSMLSNSGAVLGSFSMVWVSKYFRRARLEVDAIEGAVAPQSVNVSGQTHSFRSIFKSAGWDLNVSYDDSSIANVYTAGSIDWTYSQLHQAMQDVRRPSADLDREWLLHLLAVPENMGSGRGVMYDQIGVHREGVASFSNDGYPGPNANWGGGRRSIATGCTSGLLTQCCT